MARYTTKREAELATALLLLSRRSATKLVSALALATRALVAGRAHISQAVRAIENSQARAIQGVREQSRQAARQAWQNDAGIERPAHDSAVDALRAWAAASAIAFAWSRAQRKLVVEEALPEHVAMRRATAAVTSSAERTGETETVHAWNAETSRLDDLAAGSGYIVIETWSALIDACPRCTDLDGDTVVRPERFPQDPPLHPRCRCILISDVRQRNTEAA